MKRVYELLSIRQADRSLKKFKQLRILQPQEGWIAYIRSALALPTAQLAKLMGITQPSALAMEKREKDKTITLETLEKAADAMGCDVVYGFVPRTSLEEFVDEKRMIIVDKILERTHLSMSLENQGLNQQDLNDQRTLIIEDLKGQSIKYIWRNL